MKKKRQAFVVTERAAVRHCPACGARHDATTGVQLDQQPATLRMKPGDITICAYCGVILTVTETGYEIATQAEFAELDVDLQRLLAEYQPRSKRPDPFGRPT